MPKRYRHGQNFSNYQNPFSGAIWLIGLGILFYTGHVWPGILILVGINLVLTAVWKYVIPPAIPDETLRAPAALPAKPESAAPAPVITPAPAAQYPALPGNCPRCGAPVRPNEIRMIGAQAVTCTYCGSNLLGAGTIRTD